MSQFVGDGSRVLHLLSKYGVASHSVFLQAFDTDSLMSSRHSSRCVIILCNFNMH